MKLLSAIKKDMEFNQNLYNLVEVLKEIAIAQYRVLEKKIKAFEGIFGGLNEIYNLLHLGHFSHPLLSGAGAQGAVVAITSDAGLLGGLNMSVMSLAVKEALKNRSKLVIVGERGQMYAQESDLPFTVFKGVRDETRMQQSNELRDYILQEKLAGRIGELKIVYPISLSIVSQQVKVIQVFPLVDQTRPSADEVMLESSVGELLEYWTHLYLGQKFFQVFGQARLAELSARFNHLENSKGKVDQLNKELKLQYFRQRHEMIDRNMRELFAARLAFK